MKSENIITLLKGLANGKIAENSQRYFETNKGEYGYGDVFLGIRVDDTEDLIHKAVGWVLREIGNRNRTIEEKYLKLHYKIMPRTMLRYAIEKFEPERRQRYLKGLV